MIKILDATTWPPDGFHQSKLIAHLFPIDLALAAARTIPAKKINL